jgi:hypothetical protein
MNVPSTIISPTSVVESAEARVARYDWKTLSDELGGFGCAVIGKLLSPEECQQIAGSVPGGRSLPQPYPYGPSWLR